jgi:hypothetical protein
LIRTSRVLSIAAAATGNTLAITFACVLGISLAGAGGAAASELPRNWPMSPDELERLLANEEFKIDEVKSAGGGVTGASKLLIEFHDGKKVKVKWKAVPPKYDGWNNSPRKELAAYEVQRLFLDPNDFVVPTSVPYCIPLKAYDQIRARSVASVKGTSCVLGVISVWMNDVDAPEEFFDKKRFKSDEKYARSMADMNLLGYLIEHKDGRQGNLLVSTIAEDPRVYAVDNGISFDPFPWNFFVTNWHKIRVPFLNRASVDRLRSVDRARLDRFGVLVEMAADSNGVFHVVPAGPNMNPKKGVRLAAGRIQAGLTRHEIDDVEERIKELLEEIDEGEIKVR